MTGKTKQENRVTWKSHATSELYFDCCTNKLETTKHEGEKEQQRTLTRFAELNVSECGTPQMEHSNN